MGSVTKDGETYWIPSVTILMSRSTARDYGTAFKKIIGKTIQKYLKRLMFYSGIIGTNKKN